jgi:hypothetical protein
MDSSQESSDSGGAQSAENDTITIKSGQRSCTVCGRSQLLRETSNTVVALLHLDRASSIQLARFKGTTGHKSDVQDQFGDLRKHSAPPTKVIVKSFKDLELFTDEVEAYKRMHSIQGTIVPEFYGSGEIDELPTIVLEYIVGDDLYTYRTNPENLPNLARAVEDCSVIIAKCGVVQGDPKLDGVFVTKTRNAELTIRMIDFSHVELDTVEFGENYAISGSRANSNFLIRQYARLIGCSWSVDAKNY